MNIPTPQTVIEQLLAYLNNRISRQSLVHWAEDSLFALAESEADVPQTEVLMEVLGYLSAADTPSFPLTWERLSAFLEKLGAQVEVSIRA
ncbi:MAG: hypothetical protein DYG88_02515 [Chloroflexi bacterium CFX4]|nr:hypothetical protein [Chloroflexi bacterium CFX4]MDL1922527.1 hypothetical protein [Chloroflexi bacterium CFX3]